MESTEECRIKIQGPQSTKAARKLLGNIHPTSVSFSSYLLFVSQEASFTRNISP
jgi:hypothetical protein